MKTILYSLFILLAVFLVFVVFTACMHKPAMQKAAESAAFDTVKQRQIAEVSLAFLQKNMSDSITFGQITDLFEQLCATPTADELILFEAGTYAFTGRETFTVSLVRQIPTGVDDEFFQIRADISFLPDEDNKRIEDVLWLDVANGDDFSAVRRSNAFSYANTHTSSNIEVYITET